MNELNKLGKYLKEHGYEYERIDKENDPWGYDRHQIIVYKNGEKQWDAICHRGSYGYDEGLLEIMGNIVENTDDTVEGWLTADDIIKRLEVEA